MVNLNFLNLAPKKKPKLVITRKKTIYALIALIAVISISKTYSNGQLKKEILKTKAEAVALKINEFDEEVLNQAFTKEPFCGWKLTKESGEIFSSPSFYETSKDKKLIENTFTKDEVEQTFFICISALSVVDSSVSKQLFFILIVIAIIIALIETSGINTKETKKIEVEEGKENESETKVSNS